MSRLDSSAQANEVQDVCECRLADHSALHLIVCDSCNKKSANEGNRCGDCGSSCNDEEDCTCHLDSADRAATVELAYLGDDMALGAFGISDPAIAGGAAIVEYDTRTVDVLVTFSPKCFTPDGALRDDVARQIRMMMFNAGL